MFDIFEDYQPKDRVVCFKHIPSDTLNAVRALHSAVPAQCKPSTTFIHILVNKKHAVTQACTLQEADLIVRKLLVLGISAEVRGAPIHDISSKIGIK